MNLTSIQGGKCPLSFLWVRLLLVILGQNILKRKFQSLQVMPCFEHNDGISCHLLHSVFNLNYPFVHSLMNPPPSVHLLNRYPGSHNYSPSFILLKDAAHIIHYFRESLRLYTLKIIGTYHT